MHIECIKEKLSYALSKVERMTGKNASLPILACVLLEAENSNLTISATNLDVGIEMTIPVKVITPGKVAISGSILNTFISNLSNDKNISLEATQGSLKVSSDHSRSLIKTFPTDDFPRIPKLEGGTTFTFPSFDLLKGLKSVMFSASLSTIRPTLSSILLYSEEESVIAVATDSFRLAEKHIRVKKHKDFNQLLLPLKNTPEIIRTFDDCKGDIIISLNENQISCTYENIYMTSRIIDGTFPDYKQIIPKETKTEVTVLKQDMVSALKISNIFSDKFSQVIFTISPKNKKFTMTTKNIDIGENIHTIDAVLKGEELIISFNYKYIVDCFQSIDTDSMKLSFSDTNRPLIITPIGDTSFMYLVMPTNK